MTYRSYTIEIETPGGLGCVRGGDRFSAIYDIDGTSVMETSTYTTNAMCYSAARAKIDNFLGPRRRSSFDLNSQCHNANRS